MHCEREFEFHRSCVQCEEILEKITTRDRTGQVWRYRSVDQRPAVDVVHLDGSKVLHRVFRQLQLPTDNLYWIDHCRLL